MYLDVTSWLLTWLEINQKRHLIGMKVEERDIGYWREGACTKEEKETLT